MPADSTTWLLVCHLAVTLFMTGVIWFVQVVHYPLFAHVSPPAFTAYQHQHMRRTGWVVAVPMLIEAALAILVAWHVGGRLAVAGLVLLAVVWASTWGWQVPAHRRLERGFDAAAHRRLVATNWVRTVAWTMRAALAGVLLLTR